MTTITPPTDELNAIIRGDLDILDGYSATNGTGTLHVRNGGLYVEGLTDLDETTITTNDGNFTVLGTNKISFNISGGATSSIEMTAEDASYFTTTAGTLDLTATATDANGKITIQAAGTGPDSVLISATNTTSGQIDITCAGGSTSSDAIVIQATDSTDGNILIHGSGNIAGGNPAVKILADNATSGQILLQSAGGDTTSDAIKLLASDTTDGNILIQGSGNIAGGNPAVKILADNATSGQILLESASDAAGSDSIKLNATGSTGGNVNITAAGTTVPAINLNATGSTGQILVQSAGADTTDNAIELLASDTTDGNILIQANGSNTNFPAIKLLADNDSTGQVIIQADGDITSAVKIVASGAATGGIDIDATGGPVAIDTTNTVTGITIGTATAGVPVTVGTSSSLITVAGDLIVEGTTTTINTETLTVEDNFILLNSGAAELDIDSGIVIRRYQSANDASVGNVITSTSTIQESGAFQAGSATPGTLVLAAYASATDDFYNGWWIKITSGAGIDQVRRIKDYVGASKTVTLYVTADNTATFTDGLDLGTAPAATDTYELYSDAFSLSFYDESADRWVVANSSKVPDPVSGAGASIANIEQYQQFSSGAIDVHSQIYNNAFGSASGTTITVTLRAHGQIVGEYVGISNSSGFTPSITAGKYTVATVPDANTFTFTVPSATTSGAASSVTVTDYSSSILKVNYIEPFNTELGGINIEGLAVSEDITIPKTSTAYFFLNNTSETYGSVLVLVSDKDNTDGAFSVFIGARSTAGNGTITRLAAATGTDGQRIDADWLSTEKIKIRHKPAGVGAGDYIYRVRVYSGL